MTYQIDAADNIAGYQETIVNLQDALAKSEDNRRQLNVQIFDLEEDKEMYRKLCERRQKQIGEKDKQIDKLSTRLAALEADVNELLGQFKDQNILDLVRCGIGGNYGGDCYESKMKKANEPLKIVISRLANKVPDHADLT